MKKPAIFLFSLLVGCSATEADRSPYYGPASLMVVPPSYYSSRPQYRKRQHAIPETMHVQQKRYYYPKPGTPIPLDDPPEFSEETLQKLEEASDKIHELRKQFNKRRKPYGTRPRKLPIEDPQNFGDNDDG